MRFIYTGDFWVRKMGTIYPQQMFQRYPEVFIVGTGRRFWSSEFMFLTEKGSCEICGRVHGNPNGTKVERELFWKLQGDILGSMT